MLPREVIRSNEEEKETQIRRLNNMHAANKSHTADALKHLQQVAIENGNTFESLMEVVKTCSLGQVTHALYEVGGQYRRNM